MPAPDPPLRAHPPYRVLTERLEIRCWEPADAEPLTAAILRNREHLSPWLPFAAAETGDVDEKIALLRRFRGLFDLGEDFVYGAFDRESGAVVGGSGLHPRSPGGLEIGYWIDRERTGRGLATELAGALTRVGIEHVGTARIDIRCEPENGPSQAVVRKLGFRHEARLRARLPRPDGSLKDTDVFSLLAEELPGGPCAEVVLVRVQDALGRDQEPLERAERGGRARDS